VVALEDLEKICNLHYKYVKSYALSLCLSETLAEDITQETFYNAIKNIDTFKNDCKIETWLCSIAKNIFLNYKRKKQTENISDYTHLVADSNIEENVIKDENVKRILTEAVKLETPYKEVFYMKSLGDMTYTTIADVFGKTENWARVTYFRAKKQIEERMSEVE
jgi:RNA polymerase sigma-70 factor (ECF subfamily)